MKNRYLKYIAGLPVAYTFIFESNASIVQAERIAQNPYWTDRKSISVSHEELTAACEWYGESQSEEYVEFMELAERTGDYLLMHNRCLFHGVAVRYKGLAYLFTAPSGTGKTTHFIRWKELFGPEIEIMNGDKPGLEFCDNGTIMVHPSPWKGKENLGQDVSAPLAGIIYLQQAGKNNIYRVSMNEIATMIYRQIIFTESDIDKIRAAFHLCDRLLRRIPVWKLENIGDLESAKLAEKVISDYQLKDNCNNE